MASAAPKPPPAVTPRMSGLTRGFWNIPWKAAPLMARLPPTNMARITRGRRMLRTTVSALSVQVRSTEATRETSTRTNVPGSKG